MIIIKVENKEVIITADNGSKLNFPMDRILEFTQAMDAITGLSVQGDFIKFEVTIR